MTPTKPTPPDAAPDETEGCPKVYVATVYFDVVVCADSYRDAARVAKYVAHQECQESTVRVVTSRALSMRDIPAEWRYGTPYGLVEQTEIRSLLPADPEEETTP